MRAIRTRSRRGPCDHRPAGGPVLRGLGDGLSWINQSDGGPHEANFLKLDCSRVKRVFGWTPRWGVKDAIRLTVEWCREYEKDPADPQVTEIMDRQIGEMFQSRGL